jgi:hypothetical protein
MSDLVSRKALNEIINNYDDGTINIYELLEQIRDIPIVFDVDKVVKQLKNSYDACDYCKRKDECNECQIGEVIEIVKGGGRDE